MAMGVGLRNSVRRGGDEPDPRLFDAHERFLVSTQTANQSFAYISASMTLGSPDTFAASVTRGRSRKTTLSLHRA